MKKLISDKIPDLMKGEGMLPFTDNIPENKEFFQLLKEKIVNDLEKVGKVDTIERKSDFLVDAYVGIKTWLTAVQERMEKPLDEIIQKRIDKVGELKNRTVLLDENDNDGMKKVIMEFGEKNGWPRMVLGRNGEGQVYMWMPEGGKDAYEKVLGHYNGEGVGQLYESVLKNDRYEEPAGK